MYKPMILMTNSRDVFITHATSPTLVVCAKLIWMHSKQRYLSAHLLMRSLLIRTSTKMYRWKFALRHHVCVQYFNDQQWLWCRYYFYIRSLTHVYLYSQLLRQVPITIMYIMAKPVGGLVCTCTPTLHRSFTRQNEDTATSLADYGRALHHKAEAKSIQWRAFVTMSCESIAAF